MATKAIHKAATVRAKTLKMTVVIQDFDQHLELDTIGASSVVFTIIDPTGSKLTAALNPKSFRKAQATFKECEGNASVIVTGEFDLSAKKLNSAGLAIQVKVPKPVVEVVPSADGSEPVALDQPVVPIELASIEAAPAPIEPALIEPEPIPTEKPAPIVIIKKKRTIEAPPVLVLNVADLAGQAAVPNDE